jgi:hypothetical protein
MALTAIWSTAVTMSWAARTRGASVRCLAVAVAVADHSPIATVVATMVTRRAATRVHGTFGACQSELEKKTPLPTATAVTPAAHPTRRRIFGQPPARKNLTSAGKATRPPARTSAPVKATAASTASRAAGCHVRVDGSDVKPARPRPQTSPAAFIKNPLSETAALSAAAAARRAWRPRWPRPPQITLSCNRQAGRPSCRLSWISASSSSPYRSRQARGYQRSRCAGFMPGPARGGPRPCG